MKRLSVTLLIIVFLSVIILIIIEATHVTVYQKEEDRIIGSYTFEELQDRSEVIVRARVMPSKKDILLDLGYGMGVVKDVTATQLQIEEVYKGDLAVNEIITIVESYYISSDGLGKTMWVSGDYVPAKANQQYIFFLKKFSEGHPRFDGMYGIIELEYGKYLISDNIAPDKIDTLSNKEIELGEGHYNRARGEGNQYRDWYKKVLELYD